MESFGTVKYQFLYYKHNKRILSDWFSAALQTSRKCGR